MPKRKICADIQSEYVFTWKIKNFSSCHKAKGEYIISPVFRVENLCESRWYLRYYPKGCIGLKEDEHYASCYLVWQSEVVVETPSVYVRLDIVGLDFLDFLLCFHSDNIVFNKSNNCLGWSKFVSLWRLADEMNRWNEDTLTIRCTIECDKLKKQMICGSVGNTTIDVDRRYFEWDVKIPILSEYSEILDFSISNLYSFEVTLLENLGLNFRLKKYNSNLARPFKFKFALYDKNENLIVSKCAEHLFTTAETWRFPDIVTMDILEICKVDSSNCKFKLKCEICISKGTTSRKVESIKFITSACTNFIPDESLLSMQANIENLYDNKKHCDVTIRAGANEFPVHKLVLKTRSPVFASMFDQNMLENAADVVDVSDDEESMDSMFKYFYNGTFNFTSWDDAKYLMLAAEKYQVPSLMDKCISYLKSSVDECTAWEIFAIADDVKCENLKSYVISFMKDNATKLLAEPDWLDYAVRNIELATAVLSEMSTDLLSKYM